MSIHWIHTLFYWSLSNIACVLLQFSVGNDQRKWRQNVGHMLLFVFSGYHACTKQLIAPRLSSWLDGYPSEGVFVLSSLVPEAVSSRNDLEIEVLLIVLCSLDIMDPPTVNELVLAIWPRDTSSFWVFFPPRARGPLRVVFVSRLKRLCWPIHHWCTPRYFTPPTKSTSQIQVFQRKY